MLDKYTLQQKIQSLYPEKQFSEKELVNMERDFIRFWAILSQEYYKQKRQRELQNKTIHHMV